MQELQVAQSEEIYRYHNGLLPSSFFHIIIGE